MKGLRVVDVSTDLAGAYCTRLLASCGADVTRVEPPEGDPLRHQPPLPHLPVGSARVSARHEHLNAYKRGIVIDADSASGRPVLDALLATADVVVSSCNGDPERALAFEDELRSRWPGCAHVVTSPFGLTGPYASYKGGELVSWACGGFLQITGDPDRPPVQGGGPWADYATGATAAVGALAAVRSGVGQLVDVGTMEAMAAFHQWSLVLYTHQGVVKRRASNLHAESFHPMGPVPCKDGWVAIGIAFPNQWEGMCIGIDKPELLVDDRFQNNAERFDNAEAFNAELFPRLAEIEADTLVELLQENRVPAAKVLDVSEFLDDRQVGAREFWAAVDIGGTTGLVPKKPFRIPTSDPPFRPAPAPGHDTEAILAELGYDAGEIEALVASGAVAAETVGARS
jgi:crotonobetainyl-CoA:carnitine CoA-transferase CaiB-like acyl-CoA transferase